MHSEQKQPFQNRLPPRMHSANNPQQGGWNNNQNRGQSTQGGTQYSQNNNNNTGNQQYGQGNQMSRQSNFNRNPNNAGNSQQTGNYRRTQGQGQQQQFYQQKSGFQPYREQQQQQQQQGNSRSRSPMQRIQNQQQQFVNQSQQGKKQQQFGQQQDGFKQWKQTSGNNQFLGQQKQFQRYQKPGQLKNQQQQQFEEADIQDNDSYDNQEQQNDIVDDKRPARVLQVKKVGQIENIHSKKQQQVQKRGGGQQQEEDEENDNYSEERDEGVDDDDGYEDDQENGSDDNENDKGIVNDKRPPRVLQVKKNEGVTQQADITDDDDHNEENESYDQENNQDGSEQDQERDDSNGQDEDYSQEREDDDGYDNEEENEENQNNNDGYENEDDNDGTSKSQQNFKSQSHLYSSSNDGQISQEMKDQEKKLSEMCHETVNDAQFNLHMERGMKAFAFFEKNSQGIPMKSKALKAYYRSAAGNELEINNILSPIAINKSATRMLNEILDYFLDKKIKVRDLVVALLDRLRNLTTEFEPLSKHLSLFEGTKLMIEPKEKVLMVHLAGLNFFRRDSCLKDSSLDNGYSEKKHFEALQNLVDSLYSSYESNIDKVKRVIQSRPNEPADSLRAKILANNQLYISPLIPKVIAWRLLIRLDEPNSLHKMDRFLTEMLDILDKDQVFAAVFDMITALVRKNYFKYFNQLQNDERLDYISANAALLHLTRVRLNSAQQEKMATYPQTLEKLHFNIADKADRDSADQFLERLGSSYQELQEGQKGVKLDFSKADNLELTQGYWPNFFKGIEWRKPGSFSSVVIREDNRIVKKMVSEAEQNDFPGQVIDYLIGKERGLVVSRVPSQKPIVPIETKPTNVEYKKPSLILLKSLKQKTEEQLKAKEEADRIAEELRQQEIALRATLNEAQRQQRIADIWKKTAIDLERNQTSQILAGLVDYNQKEFANSFMLLKHFLKWKKNVKAIQRQKEMILYLDKFRNPQKIYYGLNNIPIDLKTNKDTNLFDEMKENNFEEILRVIEERDKLKQGPKQDFLDKLALSFLKDKQTQKLSHVYFKITIIGDEQNPLIADMVGSLAKYLSQGKMGIDETTFQITVTIDDIQIEYTLQLQMAKYLHSISCKDLSGSDLLIYVLNENDNEQNQNYFKTFKNQLRALFNPNISLGQNVLFLSVSDMLPKNKSIMEGMSRQTSNSFSVSPNQNSNINNHNSNKNLMNQNIPSNNNSLSPFNHGKRMNSSTLQRSHSQSDKQIAGFLNNSNNNNNNHLLNYSNSVQIEQLMLYEMNYTNVESQDSEGLVRKAIRYLHSNLKLRDMTSQAANFGEEDSNAVIQSYHVMAYRYETIDQKCINQEPFSDRMFKGGIDAAVEKSIKIKIPFETLKLTSIAIQFKEISEVLRGYKDQHEQKQNNIHETRKTNKQLKFEQKHKGQNINQHLKHDENKNRNGDNNNEQSDMKEFFIFKEIFNSCLFQLIENTLRIIESSHLVPFDQLTSFQKDTMLMLEENREYLGQLFDRLFLRGYLQRIKHSITTTLTTQYSYHSITYLLANYYKQILEITINEIRNDNFRYQQTISPNHQAYQYLISEMDETVKDNFSFDNCSESGITGNWQNVFVKLAEQLSQIFSGENDISIFLGNTFEFRLDEKKINKQASRETHMIGHWLIQLKRDTHKYLSSSSYPAAPGLLKKRKRHSHIGQEEDYGLAVRVYKEIVSFNENNEELLRDQDGNNKNQEEVLAKETKDNEEIAEMEDKKSNSISSSSEIDEEEDVEEEDIIGRNNQNLMKKRRTACLVLNSAEDALRNDKYQQKIQQLMRGEITSSPTRLNEDFV